MGRCHHLSQQLAGRRGSQPPGMIAAIRLVGFARACGSSEKAGIRRNTTCLSVGADQVVRRCHQGLTKRILDAPAAYAGNDVSAAQVHRRGIAVRRARLGSTPPVSIYIMTGQHLMLGLPSASSANTYRTPSGYGCASQRAAQWV